jgi:alanyl-tRNA synthetase
MQAQEIRNTFLEFFKEKGHKIVPSAPIVVKNDPTLLFTNAGMNQFKDYFLGNKKAADTRVADTQKCLRVSGKHNDLEEVGIDTYHHTMFEMLGNWSFGDYFKKEAITWAWELLTDRYKLDKTRLYVTVFEGDPKEGLAEDAESKEIWAGLIDPERILNGSKKDNFWEMGDSGPCGPCTEIHYDNRPEEERKSRPGRDLVNNDDPQVIEIWNNVFIEFNRKADGSLEQLPARHVDTGMGFERLVRILQAKNSNYDTDIFMPLIRKMEVDFGMKYGKTEIDDIAFRVIADHIRAVTFTIADGQLPSNNGAGYVIRRILRRACRYGYTFLGMQEPYIHQLVTILSNQFRTVFPEVYKQEDFIKNVIREEEASFLRTLASGTKLFDKHIEKLEGKNISGKFAFELYDTYGFPFDLTQLMAREKGYIVDEEVFKIELAGQKKRSKADAEKEQGDWVIIHASDAPIRFLGYDENEAEVKLLRFRATTQKGKTSYQAVFDQTPFYPEGGGQVGDTGTITNSEETIKVLNTTKENDLILHELENIPANPNLIFQAKVDAQKRIHTAANHSATHLMHAALRKVLGTHVAQKGSLVNDKILRFDFSHFAKMTDDEIARVEHMVNEKIREDIQLEEQRSIPKEEAEKKGAMMLFGEKYGEKVRIITFDPNYSIELCGGIHTRSTGRLGYFKIVSESAIAAGVRRIEAVTGPEAEKLINEQFSLVSSLKEMFKNPKDLVGAVEQLRADLKAQANELEKIRLEQYAAKAKEFIAKNNINGTEKIISMQLSPEYAQNAEMPRQMISELRKLKPELTFLLAAVIDQKPYIWLSIPEDQVKNGLHAGNMIKDIAKEINGGGGGQPQFATAVGKDADGLERALEKGGKLFENLGI